jgi:hypothetical protein
MSTNEESQTKFKRSRVNLVARYYNTFRAHRLDGLFILEKSVDLRVIIANLIPWRELERNLRISAENPLSNAAHATELMELL